MLLRPISTVLAKVRIPLEQEGPELGIWRALPIGDIESAVRFEVAPAAFAADTAVHQTEGTAGLAYSGDLVEGREWQFVAVACQVHDAGGELD